MINLEIALWNLRMITDFLTATTCIISSEGSFKTSVQISNTFKAVFFAPHRLKLFRVETCQHAKNVKTFQHHLQNALIKPHLSKPLKVTHMTQHPYVNKRWFEQIQAQI